MFERGVIEEVRAAGTTSATASQMIGLREIRELLAGKKSLPQCIAEIQQATRRYAKRQLTWFRRQTNFVAAEPVVSYSQRSCEMDLAPNSVGGRHKG